VIGAKRNETLDGLRGCLAALVLIHHALLTQGIEILIVPARLAVWTFFIMSACVLTPGWDGRYGRFLARRVVRLWPTFAFCMGMAYALSGLPPSPWNFIWVPPPYEGDPASWSLTIEMAAMLLMPLFVFVARGGTARLVIALLGTFVVQMLVSGYAGFAYFFFLGAYLSRFAIRWAPLEGRVPQWLGRISYSLYICHQPILVFSRLPLWASMPLALLVAELLTRTVEAWSIQASRKVGRFTFRGDMGKGGMAGTAALQTS
jgi:peptidoglycan/LPS O-acetylase OafA/YrhL